MDVIDLFKKLLSFPSITPDDAGSLEFIKEYLKDFKALWINREDTKNLFLFKKFGSGVHLCFAGHIDVVPPGDGWRSDPFKPIEKGGKIYARGAQDMKSGVAAFLQACKEAKDFNGTLSILLTSDEEGSAKYGTVEVLKHLKEVDFLPDFAIVAEPTCKDVFGDTIKIGRRGSINGVIKVFGKQGHAAYPQKAINPIDKIAKVLPNIAGVKLDEGDKYFAPSQFVITDIRAGMEVTNVTPGVLKMMFNVRNSTKTTKDDIKNFIEKNFAGLDYELTLQVSAEPFLTNKDSRVVKVLRNSIESVSGETANYSTDGGTSDARFFAKYGVDVVEFGVKNDTIHAPNECTTKEEVKKLKEIFSNVIEAF